MQFELKHFDELSTRELYELLHLRDLVFVVGQRITAEPEVDGLDPECLHVWGVVDGRVVATARIFEAEDPMMVGRVAVHPKLQRQGLGRELMCHIQGWLGSRTAELHAQAHLEEWYASLGWQRFGDQFVEAEIQHVMMRWPAR